MSLAIRRAGGEAPSLYITDARAGSPRTVAARDFLAAEMRSRYTNRTWIQAMQAEGYAGTLAVVNLADNLFGWQATAPGMVRQDQWQALHDVYVRDERGLGVREWFETHNPTAERQMIRRLRDAVAKGYWSPDAATRQALEARLAQIDSPSPPGATTPPGFGQGAARSAAASAPEPAPAGTPSDLVRGQVLEPIPPPAPAPSLPPPWGGLLFLLAFLAGGVSRLVSLPRKVPHAPA